MIEVYDYDPSWPSRFEQLQDTYATALVSSAVSYLAIEHVGSTSVPGLAAKPIIDVDIVVESDNVARASAVLESLGFLPRGEVGIPQRWAFWEPDDLRGTNTYVVVAGSLALRNHLTVRDTLRRDGDLRRQYGDVKKRAAAEAADLYAYGAAKNAVIQRILAAGGLTDAERASINSNQVPVTDPRP